MKKTFNEVRSDNNFLSCGYVYKLSDDTILSQVIEISDLKRCIGLISNIFIISIRQLFAL